MNINSNRLRKLLLYPPFHMVALICLSLFVVTPLLFPILLNSPSKTLQQFLRTELSNDDNLELDKYPDEKKNVEKIPIHEKRESIETTEHKKSMQMSYDSKSDFYQEEDFFVKNKSENEKQESFFIGEEDELLKKPHCSSTRHVHLSLFNEGGMTVSFASGDCDKGSGAVIYGTSRDKMNHIVVTDDVRQYQTFHPKHEWYTSEHQYHVTLTDLQPSTEYFYTCIVIPHETEYGRGRTATTQGQKKIYSFQSAPSLGEGYGMTMAIFGDVAVRPHSKECISVLKKETDVDVLLLVGDLAYSEGNHHIWDEFMDMLHFTHKTPLQVAPGNHDIEGNTTTGEMFQAFEARFRMPHIQPAQMGLFTPELKKDDNTVDLPYLYGNSFYSFLYGPSYNIVLNSFAPFAPGSIQYNWLEEQLIKVDRSVTPWLTVTLHCPLYNTFKFHHKDPQLINAKKLLEPLFVKYRVNFVLAGHIHSYSRSHPVAFDKRSSTGPIHIVLGNSGRQANVPFFNEEPEEWVLVRDHSQYGYGLLNFINATTAHYEWVVTGFNHNKRDKKARFYFPHEEDITDKGYIQNQFFIP